MNEKTIKICLLVFNTACLFVGLATLTIGILLYVLPVVQTALQSVAENVSSTQLSLLSSLMIAVGGLITFISFVGCCGAVNESKCIIGVYCIILLLLLIGQLTIGILGFVYRSEILEFSEIFERYIQTNDPIVKTLEETFNCCGYDGPQDYDPRYSVFVNSTPSTVMATTLTSTISSPAQDNSTSPVTNENSTLSMLIDATTETMTTTMDVSSSETATAGNATTFVSTVVMSTTVSGNIVSESCCKRNGSGIINKQMCLDPSRVDFQQYVKTNGCKDEILKFINQYELIIGAVSIAFVAIELIALIVGCRLFTTLD